jgi:hypothetical protein
MKRYGKLKERSAAMSTSTMKNDDIRDQGLQRKTQDEVYCADLLSEYKNA